jgi:hypothetical protein
VINGQIYISCILECGTPVILTEDFHGFPHSSQTSVRTVMTTSCKSSMVHHSSPALPFDAMLCRLNTDILQNKAQQKDDMLYFIA